MKSIKVSCVVVTYNRLSLLKECIAAVRKQTFQPDTIYIVNNHSTDNTEEYLATFADDTQMRIVSLPENVGGAGGFSRGIKEAVLAGADWVWIMDDDTIPEEDALEKLVAATHLTKKVGYVCSKVLWLDGTPHLSNKASICIEKGNISYNSYSTKEVPALLSTNATFVSVMINSDAVRELGLPISEFFIWMDDIEYTVRIATHGYDCFYVDNSHVLHKTAENYFSRPDMAPVETAWKFYYQARNVAYMKRKNRGKLALFFSTLNMYRVYLHRINKRKDHNKSLFRKHIWKGCWDSLKFNPTIEFLPVTDKERSAEK